MKKLCAEQSIRLVVVCMPSKAEVYLWLLDSASQRLSATGTSGYSAAIAKICGQLDIPYLNMTLLMADAAVGLYKSTGHMFYSEDDTHFNHIGHYFVGKKIDSAFFKTIPLNIESFGISTIRILNSCSLWKSNPMPQ